MNITTRTSTFHAGRWTTHVAAGLCSLALAGCGGGDGSSAPDGPAASPSAVATAPDQMLGVTVSGSSAAVSAPERYNRVVYQLYLAYFGRPPDPANLSQVASQLNTSGVQPELNALMAEYQKKDSKVRALIDTFANSAEFKSMYSVNPEQFVTQLFQTILGRTPAAGGKQYWVAQIASGKLPRALAAIAVMSGATANPADAATVDKKVEASTSFTSQVREQQLAAAYANTQALVSGRTLLGSVTGSTSASALNTSVSSSLTMLMPPKRAATLASIAPDALTDLRIENVEGVAHAKVPFTFGQPFAAGHMKAGDQLIGRLENGSTIALQVDVKATHADGSVRHAIISGVLPTLAAYDTERIDLLKADMAGSPTGTATAAVPANLTSRVDITLDGVKYSADLADAVAAGNAITWLAGPIASESLYSIPFKSASGVKHPHLVARFDVRSYPQLDKQARVDVVVENARTFTGAQRNFTYDVQVTVNERMAFSQSALTHYTHARWHKALWANASGSSPVHVMHNTGYLIATRAVPNYDQNVVPKEATLASFVNGLTADKLAPMKIGPIVAYMPTTGGRPDIGPLPGWAVSYLLSMDRRARASMMAAADGSGSWSIHYRDENTGYPVRLDNEVNKNISTHPNLNHKGPLPVPRCANNDGALCATPYKADTAHQPSLAYLPYLLTGDYFYLEELQFWASWNPTETDAGNHGLGQGLLRWQQLRGQAWSLRTLGQVAYITPDAHYLKGYFGKQLDNNLSFYHDTYVVGNPNALGLYDGSGKGSFAVAQVAPWQDDFFTWSFGYLNELGFSKAEAMLKWKAKFAVGRMTAPGYCWVDGAAYFMKFRDSATTPLYSSFEALYKANFKDDGMIDDNSRLITHPQGLLYSAQACGSQEQADWRTAATRQTWLKGQMTGYASSEIGYPSNMQPALAVAASAGVPNAAQAWTTFIGRGVKPDYSKGPQFAIIPR